MTKLSTNAPLREQNTCVKTTLISVLQTLWYRIHTNGFAPAPKSAHIKHINDHIARDIAIDPAEMARHRHIWPSESPDRPSV